MRYIVFAIILIVFLAGCNTTIETTQECTEDMSCNIEGFGKELTTNNNVEKIEVYHFHGASQCFSCRTIKEFAEKTVNTYYSDLVESGKMEFKSINVELPENREVSMKYGATGSSLWIGTYIDGKFHGEQNTNVWYKVRDEKAFLSYLKEFLDKRLTGDLS